MIRYDGKGEEFNFAVKVWIAATKLIFGYFWGEERFNYVEEHGFGVLVEDV